MHICFKWAAPLENSNSYAVLPFINGVTQPQTRILRRHESQVINKPLETLQQEFPSPKFRPSTEHQQNVVYKIPCADCGWCYIGETGRCFETRKKEHIRNVKTCANGSNIAKHAWSFDHRIDFDNSCRQFFFMPAKNLVGLFLLLKHIFQDSPPPPPPPPRSLYDLPMVYKALIF